MRSSSVFHFLFLVLMGCNLFSKSENPIEQLPPATQEGKNTFGCLVNGSVWLPKGNYGLANPDASYDPGVSGGALGIDAYRIEGSTFSDIYIYMTGVQSTGSFALSDATVGSLTYYPGDSCYFDKDTTIMRHGNLTITSFNLSTQIVAGNFEIVLIKTSCDTLRITNGRFDIKF